MMTWTPYSIETCRDLSVLFGHNFETNHYFDRDSIHARWDMSVEKPADFRATHDNEMDTALDSRLAGYELHTPPHEIAESTIDHGDD